MNSLSLLILGSTTLCVHKCWMMCVYVLPWWQPSGHILPEYQPKKKMHANYPHHILCRTSSVLVFFSVCGLPRNSSMYIGFVFTNQAHHEPDSIFTFLFIFSAFHFFFPRWTIEQLMEKYLFVFASLEFSFFGYLMPLCICNIHSRLNITIHTLNVCISSSSKITKCSIWITLYIRASYKGFNSSIVALMIIVNYSGDMNVCVFLFFSIFLFLVYFFHFRFCFRSFTIKLNRNGTNSVQF